MRKFLFVFASTVTVAITPAVAQYVPPPYAVTPGYTAPGYTAPRLHGSWLQVAGATA